MTYSMTWRTPWKTTDRKRCGRKGSGGAAAGHKMMDVVVSVAEQRGCSMVLDVKTDRPHLLKFYDSLGFAMSYRSVDHYRDGEDRFNMTRPRRGSR